MRQLDTLIPIAEGASGRVYRSRDRNSGEVLAVKRLRHSDPAQVARLRREAAAQQRLDHPNICRVFGVEEDEHGHVQLLMEFVPGSTLAREIDRLSLEERIDIIVKVARAIETAHQHGILHRDLKPSNILLRDNERGRPIEPVVADFGLARSEDDPVMTSTGEVLGTPAYMAPEQALGARDQVGPATDVFALGCILFEALTGRPPFEAPTISAALDRLLHEDPPHPRKFHARAPEALCRIALQCLEREPARRFGSAGELAEQLERWRQGRTVSARRYSRLYRWRRRMARQPAVTAAALGGAIMILSLGGWSLWQASTAAAREALAAELGATLSDIDNRMTIARLAPLHDIGEDRARLTARLDAVASRYGRDHRFADLVQTSLARSHLAIGNIDAAERHARRARALDDSEATRAVLAGVLLARYADVVVPVMELPVERRIARLANARESFLEPAEALLASLVDSEHLPLETLARLAVLERRFDAAQAAIEQLPDARHHEYARELLSGELSLERADAAIENAQRAQATAHFTTALETFRSIARTARSDPRPRLLACRAARGRLRASDPAPQSLPRTLADFEPLCLELDRVDPGAVSTHAARAAAYSAMAAAWDSVNEPARARELLRSGIGASDAGMAIAPDDRSLLEFRGRLFMRLAGLMADDFEAAAEAADQAASAARRLMEIAPNNPSGALLLGMVERDRARRRSLGGRDPEAAFERAAEAFERALALDPNSPAILGEAALNAVFRFYELRPDDALAAVERAQEAIALQQRALDLDSENVELLFDQGANYGDLWFHLALHPEIAPDIDRDALKQQALGMLARIRSLSPQIPAGYTQPIMIFLSQAEILLNEAADASAPIAGALDLLRQAKAADITIDRDLETWIQLTRVRSALVEGGEVAAALADAWLTIDRSEVDRSERFYRQLYLVELIGMEAKWRHAERQAPDREKLALGRETLESLLQRGRRQAVVLCNGARVLLYSAIDARESSRSDEQARRALALFEECLDLDDDLLARFEPDLELLARRFPDIDTSSGERDARAATARIDP